MVEGCLVDFCSWLNASLFDPVFRHARSRGDINRHSSAHQNSPAAAEFSRGLSNPMARLSASSCSCREVVEGAVESGDSPHFLPLNFDAFFTQNLQLHHAVEEAIHTSSGPLCVLLHHVCSEGGLSAAQVSEGTQERGFTLGNGQHLIAQGFNVLRQDFCVGDCLLRGVDEELDDGLSIACTVVGERLNVPVGIVQQPGGDGQNHVASDAAGEQERGDEGGSFQIGRAR